MAGAGIGDDVAPPGEGLLQGEHVGEGDEGIGAAEDPEHVGVELRHAVQGAPRVVRGGGPVADAAADVHAGPDRRAPLAGEVEGEDAPHREPHGADRPRPRLGALEEPAAGGGEIAHDAGVVDGLHEGGPRGEVGVLRGEAPRGALPRPEVGDEGDEALLGERAGGVEHVPRGAPHLVDHHHRGPGPDPLGDEEDAAHLLAAVAREAHLVVVHRGTVPGERPGETALNGRPSTPRASARRRRPPRSAPPSGRPAPRGTSSPPRGGRGPSPAAPHPPPRGRPPRRGRGRR